MTQQLFQGKGFLPAHIVRSQKSYSQIVDEQSSPCIYDPLTHSTGFVYSISKTFYSLCTADDISNVK